FARVEPLAPGGSHPRQASDTKNPAR
ncbi:hypothetical protein IO02_05515, partial [Salmonella enterica]